MNTGTTSKKGNFTLYTFVGYDNYDSKTLYVDSIGSWSGKTR